MNDIDKRLIDKIVTNNFVVDIVKMKLRNCSSPSKRFKLVYYNENGVSETLIFGNQQQTNNLKFSIQSAQQKVEG